MLLTNYVVGLEYATIVYCIKSSGEYSYRDLIPGVLPTKTEYVEKADWGGVSIPVLLAASEQLKTEGKVPKAIVHSHNMKGFAEVDGQNVGATQTPLKLSDSDNEFTTETGIVVCAVTENQWKCNGGQP